MGRPAFDLCGQRFGRLVATNEFRRIVGRTSERLCHCDCGNEVWIQTNKLTTGHTQSCGCWLADFKLLPSGLAARNETYANYKSDAKRRGFVWKLTDEEFDRITALPCFYCGLEPSNVKSVNRNGGRKNRLRSGDFIYSGIDRKDNDAGYTPNNVVPCCKICNRAKMGMDFNDFMLWIERLRTNV